MPKVRWVLSYVSYSEFHTLSSSEKKIENRLRFHKVIDSLKVGRFFETQCRYWYALLTYQPLKLVSHENVPLFRIKPDEPILTKMLAFVKVSFIKFISLFYFYLSFPRYYIHNLV